MSKTIYCNILFEFCMLFVIGTYILYSYYDGSSIHGFEYETGPFENTSVIYNRS